MICNKCDQELEIESFELRKDTKKRRSTCKKCRVDYVKNYKQGVLKGTIVKKIPPEIIDDMKQCSKCSILQSLTNFTKRNDSKHGYRFECNSCKRKDLQTYYKHVYNKIRRERMQSDPEKRLIRSHRNRVWKVLKRKTQKSIEYLGCDVKQLMIWLSFQFRDGMTMDNYGSFWTLDHVLPLSLFDLNNTEHQTIAFNWKNMQPSVDNSEKNNKLRINEYFNTFLSAHRFIQIHNLNSREYQDLNKSLNWLREKLR